jgi:hypothetical protein
MKKKNDFINQTKQKFQDAIDNLEGYNNKMDDNKNLKSYMERSKIATNKDMTNKSVTNKDFTKQDNSETVKEQNNNKEFNINDKYKNDSMILSVKNTNFLEKLNENDKKIEENQFKFGKLNKVDIMKIKQRLVSFSMQSFEKFDLQNVLMFWMSKIFIYK